MAERSTLAESFQLVHVNRAPALKPQQSASGTPLDGRNSNREEHHGVVDRVQAVDAGRDVHQVIGPAFAGLFAGSELDSSDQYLEGRIAGSPVIIEAVPCGQGDEHVFE